MPIAVANDCSLLESRLRRLRLQEASNRFAIHAKPDDAARAVDLLDRVGRDHPAAAREEAGLHRECVRDVGGGAVHRALDLADDAALPVGDDVAGRPAEIDSEGAHSADAIPAVKGISSARSKGFVNPGISGYVGRHTIRTTIATIRMLLT